MNFKKLTLIIGVAFLFQACSEDFFTETLEVEGEWDGPEMVIEARLDASADTLPILLHWTKPVFGIVDDRIDHVVDAEVTLLGENGTSYEFSFDTLRNYNRNYYALADPPLEEGVSYTLNIEHPDNEKVVVEATMPSSPDLADFDWDKNYRLDVLDSLPYTLLELQYQNINTGFVSHIFEYGIPDMNDTFAGNMIFRSERFDVGSFQLENEWFHVVSNQSGGQSSILFEIRSRYIEEIEDRPGAHLIIYTQSLSQDDYLFHKSVAEHTETRNTPFVEPVIVYNNIENANGIFTLINSKKFIIPFPD